MTSQCWMMSTPSASAPRAKPQATASWRTVPPRGCRSPPLDRKARVVEIEKRKQCAHLFAVEQFGVDAVQSHRIAAPRVGVALGVGMVEVQHAALRHHGVEIKFLLQSLPEFHREFIEGVVARQQIVGADDRRVAADVAGAEP